MISNSVDKEDTGTNQVSPRWFIDLDWHQQSNRSLFAMARGCLCPKCQERLKGEISAADLLTTIKDCYSKTPDFITGRVPFREHILPFPG